MDLALELDYKATYVMPQLPEGATPYKEYNVVQVIQPNRETPMENGSILRVVQSHEIGGYTAYVDDTVNGGGKHIPKVITKEQFDEVLNIPRVSKREYRTQYYNLDGVHFKLDTLGRTPVKLVTVFFDTQEEKDAFVPPAWLGERWNPRNHKK